MSSKSATTWETLSRCREECQQKIQDFSNEMHSIGNPKVYRELGGDIAECICDSLLKVFRQELKERNSEKHAFYIHPGYYRVSAQGTDRIDVIGDVKESPGYGYSFGCDDEKKFTSLKRVSRWMAQIYEKTLDGVKIEGLTRWFSSDSRLLRYNEELVAAVRFHKTLNSSSTIIFADSVYSVPIPSDTKSASQLLAAAVKGLEKLNRNGMFPPLRANAGLIISDKQRKASESLTAHLWASIFINDVADELNVCPVTFPEHDEAYQNARRTEVDDSCFKNGIENYYVFSLDPSIEVEASGGLLLPASIGTINLYSDFQIEPSTLRQIKRLLESIYTLLRITEAFYFAEELRDCETRLVYGHEIQKLLPYIAKDTPAEVLDALRLFMEFQYATHNSDDAQKMIDFAGSRAGDIVFGKQRQYDHLPEIILDNNHDRIPGCCVSTIKRSIAIARFVEGVLSDASQSYDGKEWLQLEEANKSSMSNSCSQVVLLGEHIKMPKHDCSNIDWIKAVVCLFRNIVPNAALDYPIFIGISYINEVPLLTVYNYGSPPPTQTIPKRSNSEMAAQFFIGQCHGVGRVEYKFVSNDFREIGLWKSLLPFPSGVKK